MKRPTRQSVRSKQNAILRYIISTDVDTSSKDLGVPSKHLKAFVSVKPETVRKYPERYGKLLGTDTKSVASQHDRKLVQRLSGKRLYKAETRYQKEGADSRLVRAVRLARATRTHRKIVEEGQVRYVPVVKSAQSREEVIDLVMRDLASYNVSTIREQLDRGEITEEEAREIVEYWRQLYKKADITYERFFGEDE
jgi:hypothetical protein